MSELYKLPDGWEWKTLEFVCGKDSSNISLKMVKDDDGIYPIYGAKGFIQNIDTYKIEKPYIAIIKDGAGVGRVMRCEAKSSIIGTMQYLIPKDTVDLNFLFYYLSIVDFKSYINGATIPHIYYKDYKNNPFPLPPLSEQQRIVSKLDLLFEKINKAIALHVKNMDEVDVFMGSVLNDVFGELEYKYELDKIGNMIDVLTDYHSNGAYKTLKANVELLDSKDYALMIRATDLENEDYTNNVKYITEDAYNFMSKSKVYGGEIILPKIGTIGNVYFMPYLDRPISLAMNIFMLRCSKSTDNKYLYSYLKSPKGHRDILSRANGAVTQTITKDAVRSIKLPLPPLHIQQKTVKYLDEISQKINKVKSIQKEKMASLKALKASILDKAFRGEL